MAEELELVPVQVGGGRAPEKVTNAASGRSAVSSCHGGTHTLKLWQLLALLSAAFTGDIHNEGGGVILLKDGL